MEDKAFEPQGSHTIAPVSATVAIIGRPNVGKSALFNRLIGQRLAIVDDVAGVTRDRLIAIAEWNARRFHLVDTGGIEPEEAERDVIWARTRDQAEIAAQTADVIVFLVDASEGLHPLDFEAADIVRRTRRPVIFVANKTESDRARDAAYGEFSQLGFGPPISVAAIHGEGTGDLLDAIVEKIPPEPERLETIETLSLAVIGRPNVGKSSLVNALLGEERTIVSDIPGTTRDAIDTMFRHKDHAVRLIDTAGVWRHSNAHGDLDYYASLRSYRAISRADVVALVIDSMEGVLAQDRRLAGTALAEGKGLIIIGNKWDLVRELGEYQQSELIEAIHEQMPFAAFAPVTFLSALTKRKLASFMPLALRVHENRKRRIPTARVNTIIRDAVLAHPPPSYKGRAARILYASQVATEPPRFMFSCNDADMIASSYRRYLENTLRGVDDFEGVPLSLEFKSRRDSNEE